MTKPKDGSGVSEENYIPVEEDKLKDEQKAELDKALEAYKRECLKSFSATRGGEVVKKFDFPTLQPLTETQCENKMLDMVHQAVGHAFVNHALVMTHTVHNAVIKTLGESMFQGYSGPCYMQPSHMSFTSMGSTAATFRRLSSADRKEEVAPRSHSFLVQHYHFRRILSSRILRQSPHQCKGDPHRDSRSGGTQLLDLACPQDSLLHQLRGKVVHRLPYRRRISRTYRFHSRWCRIHRRPSRRDRIQHWLHSRRLSSGLLRQYTLSPQQKSWSHGCLIKMD